MYQVKHNDLNVTTYHLLRDKVGFKKYVDEDVEFAIKHSLYNVVIYDMNYPVGMARLVGDNRICFFLKDVVVDPQYQKLKVGKLLMDNLFLYISKYACEGAYIGLMSTCECVAFYEKFGFHQRPSKNLGPGMIKFYTEREVIE